jgi:iron(II)-dependent oxidoreductase
VLDLSGNVWEWTMSDYNSKSDLTDFVFDDEKSQKWPVLRGGSWGGEAVICCCAYRYWYYPVFRIYNFGFRCARTVTL